VMLDIVKEKGDLVSLLDLGCGAGHLYDHLKELETPIQYSGLDISDKFISVCRNKYPDVMFYEMDILDDVSLLPEFDYIVANGVFTEKRSLDYEEMLDYFKEMIKVMFSKCSRGIAFNVMSTYVEWKRDDLFHLPLNDLSEFLVSEVSQNFVIRNDYGLYEYTSYVYK
ncbi:MAG TPA: class I SAM-dependent methyltransferase, partial [Ignavibacteria bacterium]|nr:class I SAM-dependent methyltransferase [Ignavibacteria bacterium]